MYWCLRVAIFPNVSFMNKTLARPTSFINRKVYNRYTLVDQYLHSVIQIIAILKWLGIWFLFIKRYAYVHKRLCLSQSGFFIYSHLFVIVSMHYSLVLELNLSSNLSNSVSLGGSDEEKPFLQWSKK